MNLKLKEDRILIHDLQQLRSREKELVTEILNHLVEVERRKLHLERGYSSLFVFCTEALGYSKDEAYIRIQAARLLQALPEVEEKIRSGDRTFKGLI